MISSHVFEHVNDKLAMAEVYRILKKGGLLIAMIPIIEGWNETFEDDSITSEEDRDRYFGQNDHVRMYGSDFRDRLAAAGFRLEEFTASGSDSPSYRLKRGDKVFLAYK